MISSFSSLGQLSKKAGGGQLLVRNGLLLDVVQRFQVVQMEMFGHKVLV